jgi:hypothetical protein
MGPSVGLNPPEMDQNQPILKVRLIPQIWLYSRPNKLKRGGV